MFQLILLLYAVSVQCNYNAFYCYQSLMKMSYIHIMAP